MEHTHRLRESCEIFQCITVVVLCTDVLQKRPSFFEKSEWKFHKNFLLQNIWHQDNTFEHGIMLAFPFTLKLSENSCNISFHY